MEILLQNHLISRQQVREYMNLWKKYESSIAVIESSTTGKYEIHMVAPPERRVSIKIDRRDAERIVMIEDVLNYLRGPKLSNVIGK